MGSLKPHFGDVSENISFPPPCFKFPLWGYFYKFDWTTTKKKKKKRIKITNGKACASASSPLCTLIALKQRPCVVFSQGHVGRWNESEWREKKQLSKTSALRGKWNRAAPEQPEDQQHEDNSQGQPFPGHGFPASTSCQLPWFTMHHWKGLQLKGMDISSPKNISQGLRHHFPTSWTN